MAGKRSEVYQIVTDRMMEALAAGVVPWRQPWGGTFTAPLRSSGASYRGFNRMLLSVIRSMKGYRSRVWLTYNQAAAFAKANGGTGGVKRGEKGTPVVFFKWLDKEEKRTDGTTKKKKIPLMRYYTVFNADQCDGLKLPEALAVKDAPPVQPLGEPSERCKAIMAGYTGPTLTHGGTGAWSRPQEDRINLPELGNFTTPADYFATWAHEAGHSTGHKSRLDRKTIGESYHLDRAVRSTEELVAEMTSTYLCANAGVTETFENSAAYVASWHKYLANDPGMLISAAGQAEKAAEFILGASDEPEEQDEE